MRDSSFQVDHPGLLEIELAGLQDQLVALRSETGRRGLNDAEYTRRLLEVSEAIRGLASRIRRHSATARLASAETSPAA